MFCRELTSVKVKPEWIEIWSQLARCGKEQHYTKTLLITNQHYYFYQFVLSKHKRSEVVMKINIISTKQKSS